MKHTLNLPERPNIIFLIFAVDIFFLIGCYTLYGSNWVGQAGQELTLESSQASPIQFSDKALQVRVFGPENPQCIVGSKSIPLSEIKQELLDQQKAHGVDEILLIIDQSASVAKERELLGLFQQLQLKVYLIAEPTF